MRTLHSSATLKRVSLICGIALLVITQLVHAAAQDNASLRVQVVDPIGAIVVNAVVTATDSAGAKQQSTMSSNETYLISGLMPGKYSVTVEAPGFRASKEDVDIAAGRQTTLKVTLE